MEFQYGRTTGIWWDVNSCEYPPYMIHNLPFPITSFLSRFGIQFPAILSSSIAYVYDSHINREAGINLQNAGFCLSKISQGDNQNLEKKMITDIMLWAMDNNTHHANIVLVSANIESFSYTLAKLHERKFRIFVCSNNIMQTSIPYYCHSYLLWPHFVHSILQYSNNYTTSANHVYQNFPAGLLTNNSHQLISNNNSISPAQGDDSNGCVVERHENIYESNAMTIEDFKTWFIDLVNSKDVTEKGYDISRVAQDFEKSTGKNLNLQFLGCNKLLQLVKECSDKVVVKETKPGVHLAFPTSEWEESSENENPLKEILSPESENPIKEIYPGNEENRKASKEEFNEFMFKMLVDGDFKEGLFLDHLAKLFAEKSGGLLLDHQHLGFNKFSCMVSSWPYLSIKTDEQGRVSVFPSEQGLQYCSNMNGTLFDECATKSNSIIMSCEESVSSGDLSSSIIMEDCCLGASHIKAKSKCGKTHRQIWKVCTKNPNKMCQDKDLKDEMKASSEEFNNNSHQLISNNNSISPAQGEDSNGCVVERHENIYESNAMSIEDFKTWFIDLVNSKDVTEKGYNISRVAQDLEKSTGKNLNLKFLGCDKLLQLVKECSDKVVVKETKPGVHLAFPTPEWEESSENENPIKEISSSENENPIKEIYPGNEESRKASKEEFNEFMFKMLVDGDFKEGLLFDHLVKLFAEKSGGLLLDHQHLGFNKFSCMVSSWPYLGIKTDEQGRVSVFPSEQGLQYCSNMNGTLFDECATKTNSIIMSCEESVSSGDLPSSTIRKDCCLGASHIKAKSKYGKTHRQIWKVCTKNPNKMCQDKDWKNKAKASSEEFNNNSHQLISNNNSISRAQGDDSNGCVVERHENIYESNAVSTEDFKTWFVDLVNSKDVTEKGYDISRVAQDLEKSTGKNLNLKFLGCNKLLQLVKECSDKVVVKETKPGVHLAFPKPEWEESSENENPIKEISSSENENPIKEIYPGNEENRKASKEESNELMFKMLADGDFKEGLLLDDLVKLFAEKSGGLLLDHQHLGFNKFSSMVSSWPYLSIKIDKQGRVSVFPSKQGLQYCSNMNGTLFDKCATKSNSIIMSCEESVCSGDLSSSTIMEDCCLGASHIKAKSKCGKTHRQIWKVCTKNPNKTCQDKDSKDKTKASSEEFNKMLVDGKSEIRKASEEEFNEFILEMLVGGYLKEGLLLDNLVKVFGQKSGGLLLDHKNLGFNKLSSLVSSCPLVFSKIGEKKGQIVVFPSTKGLQYCSKNGIVSSGECATKLNCNVMPSANSASSEVLSSATIMENRSSVSSVTNAGSVKSKWRRIVV